MHGRLRALLALCYAAHLTGSSSNCTARQPGRLLEDDVSTLVQQVQQFKVKSEANSTLAQQVQRLKVKSEAKETWPGHPGLPGAPYVNALDNLAGFVTDATEMWASKSIRGRDAKNKARELASDDNIYGTWRRMLAAYERIDDIMNEPFDLWAGVIYKPTPAPTPTPTHIWWPTMAPTGGPPTRNPTSRPTQRPSAFGKAIRNFLKVMVKLHLEILGEMPTIPQIPNQDKWKPSLREGAAPEHGFSGLLNNEDEGAAPQRTRDVHVPENAEPPKPKEEVPPMSDLPTDCKDRPDGIRYIKAMDNTPFKVRCLDGEVITPYTE